MEAVFYRHSKKPNSTKRPGGAGASYNCFVYEPCTTTAPVLILDDPDAVQYNYCYIQQWGRYYWITAWEFSGGRMLAHLNVDVLASWKTYIGESTQYVTRSGKEYNIGIQDRVFTTYAHPTIVKEVQDNPLDMPVSEGSYIVSVLGGKTAYYALTLSELNVLTEYIFSDAYADEVIGEVFTDVYPELKAQLNPLQYIASIAWVPVSWAGSSPVTVGWVQTPARGTPIPEAGIAAHILTFSVPNHPQGAAWSYLNYSPYSTYQLYIPPFGMIPLDSNAMAAYSSITVFIRVDPRTLEGVLEVSGGDNVVISRVTSKVGVPIQMAQITAPGFGAGSVIQAAAGAVSGIASVVSAVMGGNIAGGVGAAANTIGNMSQTVGDVAQSRIPSVNSIGSAGGFAALSGDAMMISTFLPIVEVDTTHKGRPLYAQRQVSSLGGYLEIYWPHIDAPASDEELRAIYTFLEGGFYYE